MANQSALQVDKIIITRQNPEALEAAPPTELEYGELAVDQTGKLYTADKNNTVLVAGGGEGQEWSEIDNQTAAEPPNPRQADQLGGYNAQALIEKAIEAATLIDDLTPPEPETIKDADTLNGIDSSGFATAAQGTLAASAVQTVNGLPGPNPSLTAATIGAAADSTPVVSSFGQFGGAASGTFEIYGKILAVRLPGGLWRVDFTGKIETNTVPSGLYGLSVDLIQAAIGKSLSMPTANSPIFYAYGSTGLLSQSVVNYSGTMLNAGRYLTPARFYETGGRTGAWPPTAENSVSAVGNYWTTSFYLQESS